jgi:hypothetical protein
VNKAPNLELLDHEYKRLIEIKCVEFEDLMEGKVCAYNIVNQTSKILIWLAIGKPYIGKIAWQQISKIIKISQFILLSFQGFSEEEINAKVNEYRKLLFNEFENGRLNMDEQLDLRNSHSRAKVAKDTRENMRWALGIDASFVDGSSLEK